MISNYSCSLNSVLAWIAWTLAAIGAGLYAFVDLGFGVVSVLLALAGATLHIHGFIHALERREVEAFELGRKSVRAVR